MHLHSSEGQGRANEDSLQNPSHEGKKFILVRLWEVTDHLLWVFRQHCLNCVSDYNSHLYFLWVYLVNSRSVWVYSSGWDFCRTKDPWKQFCSSPWLLFPSRGETYGCLLSPFNNPWVGMRTVSKLMQYNRKVRQTFTSGRVVAFTVNAAEFQRVLV